MTVRPDSLIAAADRLLRPPAGAALSLAPGLRARAAAVLLRMALEQALDAYWRRVTPRMTRVGKHRMLCLEWYAGRDIARRCRTTWAALSAACHYRTYELPPAPVEIQARLVEVAALLTALGEPDKVVSDGSGSRPTGRVLSIGVRASTNKEWV